ncbi:MAG: GNAT family protein [Pseudomonadota bacterium]
MPLQEVGQVVVDWIPPHFPMQARMDGRYVCLEPLVAKRHSQALFDAFAEDRSGRNWTYRLQDPFETLADFQAWLGAIEAGTDPLYFAYVDKETGLAAGMGAFMTIAPAAGSIEIGSIMLAPVMQGRRSATEAHFLMIDWAFGAGYRRCEWTCDALNAASIAAAHRLGFSYEALFRQAKVYKGRNRDEAILSILDHEWPARRAAIDAWLAPGNFGEDGTQQSRLSSLTAPMLAARSKPFSSAINNPLGQPVSAPVPEWTIPPRPGPMTLSGRTCRLEPLNAGHAPDLFKAFSADGEGSLWTYMPNGPFGDLAGYRAWLDDAAAQSDPLQFAILVDERPVGTASFLRIDPSAGSIEVGYITYSPELQRTPAATETMFLMMKWAFDAGYRRYEWKCNALNAPSRRAAKRLGFTYEGTFRQALVVKGHNRDSAWFAITDAEWRLLRPAFERWLDASNFNADGTQKTALSTLTADALAARRH